GTAALLLAIDPFMSGGEVRQAMKETADKIDPGNGNYDASGHSASFGFGRVNAENAVLSRLQLV
ncbi:MAG: peptidase S8, partial [Pseudomonadota bacterium]